VIALPCLLYSMELRLFRAPAFSAALTAFLLGIFVMAGMIFFITQYLQLVLGRVMIQDPPQQPRQVIALIRRE
jgi:hypothetical protein